MKSSEPEWIVDWCKENLRYDNRIENLRDVPHTHNQQNIRHRPSDNKYAKTVGVTPCERTGKWRARLTIDGRLKSFGSYSSIEEAEAAYKEAKRKYHPGWLG